MPPSRRIPTTPPRSWKSESSRAKLDLSSSRARSLALGHAATPFDVRKPGPSASIPSVTATPRKVAWPKDFLQRIKGNFEASQTRPAPWYSFYVNALSVACLEGSSAYGKPVTDPVSHRPSLPCRAYSTGFKQRQPQEQAGGD